MYVLHLFPPVNNLFCPGFSGHCDGMCEETSGELVDTRCTKGLFGGANHALSIMWSLRHRQGSLLRLLGCGDYFISWFL